MRGGYWPDGCEHIKRGESFAGTVETDDGTIVDVYIFEDGKGSGRYSTCLRYGDRIEQYATGPSWCTGYRWNRLQIGAETAAWALEKLGITTKEGD